VRRAPPPRCDAAGVPVDPSPTDSSDLALALALADAADALTLPRFRAADLRVDRKPDRTPVTDADTAAEAALRALIAEHRPGDEVLGEEEGGELSADGRGWVLDPIDGTKNFSRGMPAWATLIALTVDGEPVVGVASAPALGRRWWGARGLGAWASDGPGTDPRRISVSAVAELGDAYLSTTDLRVFGQQGRMDRWLALVDACWETRAFGDFWQHCLVAEGVLDLAVDPVANAWDLAALVPILTEAGGRMTGLSGSGSFAEGDGIASNGRLHEPALALVGTGRG
jgi:histidinol-phosphatase